MDADSPLIARAAVLGGPLTGKTTLIKALRRGSRGIKGPHDICLEVPPAPNSSNLPSSIAGGSADAIGLVTLRTWEYPSSLKLSEQEEEAALSCSLLCIVLLDLRRAEDFAELDAWLDLRDRCARDSVCLVVGTFLDCLTERNADIDRISSHCRTRGALYLELSLRRDPDLGLLRVLLLQQLREAISIREQLEEELAAMDAEGGWNRDAVSRGDDDGDAESKSDVNSSFVHSEGKNEEGSLSFPLLQPLLSASSTAGILSSALGATVWPGVETRSTSDDGWESARATAQAQVAKACERVKSVVDAATAGQELLDQRAGGEGALPAFATMHIDEDPSYMKGIDRFQVRDHFRPPRVSAEEDVPLPPSAAALDSVFSQLGLNYADLTSEETQSLDRILAGQESTWAVGSSSLGGAGTATTRPFQNLFAGHSLDESHHASLSGGFGNASVSSNNSISTNSQANSSPPTPPKAPQQAQPPVPAPIITSTVQAAAAAAASSSSSGMSAGSQSSTSSQPSAPSKSAFPPPPPSIPPRPLRPPAPVVGPNKIKLRVRLSSHADGETVELMLDRSMGEAALDSLVEQLVSTHPYLRTDVSALRRRLREEIQLALNSRPPSSVPVAPAAAARPVARRDSVLRLQIPPVPGKESPSEPLTIRIRVGDDLRELVDSLCSRHQIFYLRESLMEKVRVMCL